ncbi:MAG: hypothetical protein GY767_02715 [Shimia sp.]|nr:hypothetical protein [Shimia sp.]
MSKDRQTASIDAFDSDKIMGRPWDQLAPQSPDALPRGHLGQPQRRKVLRLRPNPRLNAA